MAYILVLFYVIAASTIALNMIVNKIDAHEYRKYQSKQAKLSERTGLNKKEE